MRGSRGVGFRPSVVQGTIAQVDPTRSRIAITTPRGEVSVDVAGEAQIVRVDTATAADLKVGQTVTLRGRPNTLSAVSVSIGEQTPPIILRRGENNTSPAGRALRNGLAPEEVPIKASSRGNGLGRGQEDQGLPFYSDTLATVTGTVSKLDPLTITTGEGTTVTVSLDADTRIIQHTLVSLSEVRVGERVFASGERHRDDALQAQTLRLGEVGVPRIGTRGAGAPGEGQGAGQGNGNDRGTGPGARNQAGEDQGDRETARGGRGAGGGGQGAQGRGGSRD